MKNTGGGIITDKVDLKTSTLNNDEPIHQDVTILNVHVPDNRVSEYTKQKQKF